MLSDIKGQGQLSANSSGQLLGVLQNHDDDGKGNFKKAIGLMSKNNNSARASRHFVHFFAVPAQLRREMTKF